MRGKLFSGQRRRLRAGVRAGVRRQFRIGQVIGFARRGFAFPFVRRRTRTPRPRRREAPARSPAGATAWLPWKHFTLSVVVLVKRDAGGLVGAEILAPFRVGGFVGHPQAVLRIVGDGARASKFWLAATGTGASIWISAVHAQAAEIDVIIALIVGIPGHGDFAVGRGGDRGIPIAAREKETIGLLGEAVAVLRRGQDLQVVIAESLPRHPDAALESVAATGFTSVPASLVSRISRDHFRR